MRRILRKVRSVGGRIRPDRGEIGTAAEEVMNLLDAAYYLRINRDVADAGMTASAHFLQYGLYEGRLPSALFSPDYIYAHLSRQTLIGQTPPQAYAGSGLAQKPRLIFVSHEASRTGAPAIILRLLDMFSKSGLFECFSILDKGGERLGEFQDLSHTHVMSHPLFSGDLSDEDAFAELAQHFEESGIFSGNAPVCALVNSAGSHRIGRDLARLGVPVVSLIHEIAAYYPPEVFEGIVDYSAMTIFPSQFVSRAAETFCNIDMSKTIVRGQGLLADDFGTLDQATCRRVLRENLGLEPDAFVVLNVGTVDMRKGADMFVDIAKLFHDAGDTVRPVYFVWHGAPDEQFTYAQDFIARHGLEDRVRLLPSTSEIEQVFLGGDLFLLTARADPFPCVIHEAMTCGLPVVAFHNGGGAPELIGEDCGTIVGMGDLKAAEAAIRRYVQDPELLAEQGRVARQKIARDWDYASYCADVYKVIQDSAKLAPTGGWPVMMPPRAEPHLVVMRGRMEDVALLQVLGLADAGSDCLIALIDGRFGREADRVVAALRALGLRYHLCQPTEDSDAARATRLADLLSNPRPRQVTFINTLQYLALSQLQPLAVPKRAVVTDETLTRDALYALLNFLDQLFVGDACLREQLIWMNPNAARILGPIPDATRPSTGAEGTS